MNLNESLRSAAHSGALLTQRSIAFARSEMNAFLGCALGCYLGFIVLFLLKADPETTTFGEFLNVIHSSSKIAASFIAAALSVALRSMFTKK
ncbi:hypothetical protein MRY17_13785 [Pseudomonas orientalis]|uniref:hypothetical protein n=1 Tax=Pseudomonas orientalis TaxID=76758 RepID=UPI001FAEB4BD|nr:hypothetical protein [Pseudomonas orientalis]UOB21824.1 hypothetical protein MRY17_13785 [Pseudomonas orientalis]